MAAPMAMPMQPSGALVELLTSIMSPLETPAEISAEEMGNMSKAERAGYHQARMLAVRTQKNASNEGLSKAERRAMNRGKQDLDRRRKGDAARERERIEEDLAELRLQGLTHEQARFVLAQITEAEVASQCGPEDEVDEGDDESLLDSVRRWMGEQAEFSNGDDSLRDFNLKVRFQGHVDTTPPDHLSAILHVLSCKVSAGIDPANPPKQPSEVALIVAPSLARWAPLVNDLYRRCDVIDVTDAIVSSVHAGTLEGAERVPESAQNIAMVGVFMAIRNEIDCITDEDILAGCHQLESESNVVQKFVAFLEEQIDDSDDTNSDSVALRSSAGTPRCELCLP